MSNIIENSSFPFLLTAKICSILINQPCAAGKKKKTTTKNSHLADKAVRQSGTFGRIYFAGWLNIMQWWLTCSWTCQSPNSGWCNSPPVSHIITTLTIHNQATPQQPHTHSFLMMEFIRQRIITHTDRQNKLIWCTQNLQAPDATIRSADSYSSWWRKDCWLQITPPLNYIWHFQQLAHSE